MERKIKQQAQLSERCGSDVIQRVIQTEREQLEVKRKYYLTKKGDYSFHDLNSIQGQLGVLDRLEGVLKNVV